MEELRLGMGMVVRQEDGRVAAYLDDGQDESLITGITRDEARTLHAWLGQWLGELPTGPGSSVAGGGKP